MNRYERPPNGFGGEAQLHFMDADFKIVRPGAFVRCTVTGRVIPLGELRYWNVELQEAYADTAAVIARVQELAANPNLALERIRELSLRR